MTDLNDLNQNSENLSQDTLSPEIHQEVLNVEIPAETSQDTLASDLEKAKLESQVRVDRLREIGKTAAAAALNELKAGSKELGTIAKNRLTNVATSFSSNPLASEPTSEPTSDYTQPLNPFDAARLSDLIAHWLRNLRVTLGLLDTKLDERYGDRYQAAKQTAKQRFDETAVWYSTTLEKAKANPDQSTLVEQKQREMAAQAEVAGSIAAQKEQQLKQQIKQFVQTALSKS